MLSPTVDAGWQKLFCFIYVTGSNTIECDGLKDELHFSAGENVTITSFPSNNTIMFTASGGGGGGGSGEVFTWTADHNANGNRLLNVLNASSSTGTFVFDDQKLQLYNIATSAATIQIDNDKKTAGTSHQIVMRSLDTNDNRLIYARIFNSILDATDGSEDGELRFDVVQGGTITETFTCGQIGSYYGCYIQELDRFCLDGSSCGEYINANSGVLNFVAANVARMTVYSSHVEFFSDLRLDNKNDVARSTCNGAYTGAVFFNTDDGNLNICDGTNWILPDGTVT